MTQHEKQTAVVVSAHFADSVWRARNSNRHVKYAEAYQRIFPQVTEVLQ